MTIGRLNRLCDRTLKALAKGKITNKYEVNSLDDKPQLPESLFGILKIKEQEISFIVDALTGNDFVEVISVSGMRSSLDNETKMMLTAAIYEVRIKRSGTIFIKSTSFKFEAIKSWVKLWWPLVISTLAFSISAYSVFAIVKTKSEQETISSKLKNLEHKFDSLQLQFYPAQNQNDTSKTKDLQTD